MIADQDLILVEKERENYQILDDKAFSVIQ